MPTFSITRHARRRMGQRGITENDLRAALAACYQHTPSDGDGWMHHSQLGEQIMKVVTAEQTCTGRLTVITVMWKDR